MVDDDSFVSNVSSCDLVHDAVVNDMRGDADATNGNNNEDDVGLENPLGKFVLAEEEDGVHENFNNKENEDSQNESSTVIPAMSCSASSETATIENKNNMIDVQDQDFFGNHFASSSTTTNMPKMRKQVMVIIWCF